MSLWQPFSGDRATDERLATKDVKVIQLLNTHYTASQWMEVLKVESVALKFAAQYSVQQQVLAALICAILGETHLVTNGCAKAIVLDERDLELYEGNGDIQGQMITLHCLGSCHKSLGNYKQAIIRFTNAASCEHWLQERPMIYCTNLGCCYSKAGDHAKAITLQEQSLQIFNALKDRTRLGQVHSHLATCLEASGEYGLAIKAHLETRTVAKEVYMYLY